MVRLDHAVAQACGTKVSVAQELIWGGAVAWEGEVINSPAWQVVEGLERISLAGVSDDDLRRVKREPILLLMHKPRGVSCERMRGSASWLAARGRLHDMGMGLAPSCEVDDVYDLVPLEHRHPTLGVYGRLDKETTGLLLLGTDGGLQSMLMHPKACCTKVYRATLKTGREEWVLDSESAAAAFAEGVLLADGTRCGPALLEVLERDATNGHPSVVRVQLHDGRYHVVKRMLAAVHGWVASLHREAIGTLHDACLPPGAVREVTREELQILVSECISREVRDGADGPRRGIPGTTCRARPIKASSRNVSELRFPSTSSNAVSDDARSSDCSWEPSDLFAEHACAATD